MRVKRKGRSRGRGRWLPRGLLMTLTFVFGVSRGQHPAGVGVGEVQEALSVHAGRGVTSQGLGQGLMTSQVHVYLAGEGEGGGGVGGDIGPTLEFWGNKRKKCYFLKPRLFSSRLQILS